MFYQHKIVFYVGNQIKILVYCVLFLIRQLGTPKGRDIRAKQVGDTGLWYKKVVPAGQSVHGYLNGHIKTFKWQLLERNNGYNKH